MQQLRNIYEIDAERIAQHPDNPRKDLGDLSELTASVRENGILQDITVMPECGLTEPKEDQGVNVGDLHEREFVVLLGHRRLAAFKAAFPQGGKIKCKIVYGLSRAEQVGMMMEENMHREDLTVPEQIESFQLMLDLGETVASVAEKTGFSETTVRRRIANADVVGKIRDCGFQLSIGDMDRISGLPEEKKEYVLEKAGDPAQLAALVSQVKREMKREADIADIISRLKAAGVRKYEGDDWYRLSVVKTYRARDEIILKDGEYYYKEPDRWEDYVQVRTIKPEDQEETEEERKERQAEEKRSEAVKKLSAIDGMIKEKITKFAAGILKGEYRTDNRDAGRLLERIAQENISIWYSDVANVAMSAEEIHDEEKEKEIVKNAGAKEYLLAGIVADTSFRLTYWNGEYMPDYADDIRFLISALGEYGFPPLDDEEMQVLEGTHPLFEEAR